MRRSIAKSSQHPKPPRELVRFFEHPPLALNENREEYEELFAAFADAVKPADAIAWILVRDFTDLSWEIQREKNLKRKFIEGAQRRTVARIFTPKRSLMDLDFSTPAPGEEKAREIASQWAKDPKERGKIDKQLADLGHDTMDILSSALCGEPIIDAIDQRIASYELRRMATLKAIEHYSEKLARRVEAASLEIIEGQFTEAAE